MTVVVGYIPDQYGEAALTAGIEEAERRGTGLVVVNATKGDALVDRRYVGEAGLAGLQERLAGLDLTHEVRQAIGPDVAQEILRVAADTDAAVVVIGLRHRTPVGKMIMGSVAQQVLLDAHCAVLAVKPRIRDVAKPRSQDAIRGFVLVGRGGVEPPTFHFSGGRSYQLSYLPERRSPYPSRFGDSESCPLPFDLHLAPIV